MHLRFHRYILYLEMLESYANISFLLSGELYASESFLNFTHRLQ